MKILCLPTVQSKIQTLNVINIPCRFPDWTGCVCVYARYVITAAATCCCLVSSIRGHPDVNSILLRGVALPLPSRIPNCTWLLKRSCNDLVNVSYGPFSQRKEALNSLDSPDLFMRHNWFMLQLPAYVLQYCLFVQTFRFPAISMNFVQKIRIGWFLQF